MLNELVQRHPLFEPFAELFGLRDCLPIDIQEVDNSFIVTADVPGAKHEDLTINVEDGRLSLSYKRSQETKNLLYQERSQRQVSRVIPIPRSIDTSTVAAELKDGVLTVTMKKMPEKMSRKIEVKVG